MAIGIVHVDIALDHLQSLKEKRSILKPIIEKIRNKHNVSISEVDGMDEISRATLGIAHISNDPKFTNRTLSTLVTNLEESPEVRVTDYTLEVL